MTPGTLTGWVTITYNSNSRGTDVLWPLHASRAHKLIQYIYTQYIHTVNTYIQLKRKPLNRQEMNLATQIPSICACLPAIEQQP